MKAQTIVITMVVLLLTLTVNVQPIEAQTGCTDSYEPNNDASSARALRTGSIQATICPTGDWDIYTFTLASGDSIYLSLSNLPADFDIGLYSSNQDDWVAISDNGGTESEEIRWTTNSNDVVYIVVWAYGNNVASRTPYTLNLRHFPNLNLEPGGTSGGSAQLQYQLEDLRPLLTQSDYAALVEALDYALDAGQCILAIKTWRSLGFIAVDPTDYDPRSGHPCAGALIKIVEIMGKYINPNVVGSMANCDDISFSQTIRGTISSEG